MKTVKSLALILFLLACFSSRAQLINPPTGREFGLSQKFNPEFIARNNIRNITLDVDIKKDGDRIRDSFQKIVYHFYPDGNVKMIEEINHKLRDTMMTWFQYVGKRLECEVKNDAAGMYSYCYTYDNEGRRASEKYGRAPRSESLTASIGPALTADITTETYSYKSYENQLHSTLHNALGRPYRKEIRYFDPHGYLVKYIQTFIMAGDHLEEDYTYNSHGLLASKEVTTGKDAHKVTYEYDEIGNLYAENYYRENELIYRKEYVYNKADMLLTAELKREEKNHLIIITTYAYNEAK